MGSAVKGTGRPVEIRIRFEPGLGSALYASVHEGEVAPLTVSRILGRGRALLDFHGVTLMAHGIPEWKAGETFRVVVKELGPPLVLQQMGGGRDERGARVTVVDSAVVPGSVRSEARDARG